MTKKIYSILLIVILTVSVVFIGYKDGQSTSNTNTGLSLFSEKEGIEIWYTDAALEGYLTRAALQYADETGVKVTVTRVSGLQYLEQINEANVSGNDAPDLYIVSNDLLEKASLSGLAIPVTDPQSFLNATHFSGSALHAATYKGDILGYPLYFETSVFLYNETYMHDAAVTTIENERNTAEGEAAQEAIDAATTTEELEAMVSDNTMEEADTSADSVEAKKQELIPSTINDILTFAESYDAPETVEAVFKWDVSDIFYNYFIVGDSINVGGECGDDPETIDIYNPSSVECMTLYQSLNQFFSIDSNSVTYDEVLEDFISGKIVYTVATTDAIGKVEAAKSAGEFQYDYGVSAIPRVSETLNCRSLSVTNVVAINGFSTKEKEANDFASYLVMNQDQDFYTATDKIASRSDLVYENEAINASLEEYAMSIPMPKMMRTSSFWAQLEIAFTKIWDGEDPDAIMQQLDQAIQAQ